MARVIKIPNEVLKKLSKGSEKRKVDARNIRKYYLLVSEGAKTEPNYFEGLKNDLPKGVLTSIRIDIEGTGRNTISLVDESIRLKTEYEKITSRPIDSLWIIFDKDSFPPNDFNNAINKCNALGINCAWSNEAFELWYLLHFHFYNTPWSRQDYQALIEENLRPHLGEQYAYKKNSSDMYALLKAYGDVKKAIRNAASLHERFQERRDFADHNPCTVVYKLVAELLDLGSDERL